MVITDLQAPPGLQNGNPSFTSHLNQARVYLHAVQCVIEDFCRPKKFLKTRMQAEPLASPADRPKCNRRSFPCGGPQSVLHRRTGEAGGCALLWAGFSVTLQGAQILAPCLPRKPAPLHWWQSDRAGRPLSVRPPFCSSSSHPPFSAPDRLSLPLSLWGRQMLLKGNNATYCPSRLAGFKPQQQHNKKTH